MWKYLAIQGLLFFLYFQPDLVASRMMRILLIVIGVLAAVMSYFYAQMDPFVWVLYCTGIFLTYWMAQKALRWVSMNRQRMRSELSLIRQSADKFTKDVKTKDTSIGRLQTEINHISHVYDKVKAMSRSLNFFDVFVDLSEVLMENFSLMKSRLILLRESQDGVRVIERVYQIDKAHLDKSRRSGEVVQKDKLFAGEIYPFDVHLVEVMNKDPRSIISWRTDTTQSGPKITLPSGVGSFLGLPVVTSGGLSAVLTLEGADQKDEDSISILTDRFMSEFQRIKLYADVQRLAITDYLTGVYVRRYFFGRLEEELARSARFNLKFSFLMIDLDDFKKCNDQHGHMVGDAILKETADVIKDTVREVDLVGRYGGEEFAAILLDTDEDGAMYVAERIRKALAERVFKIYDLDLKMTASIGVATYNSSIKETTEIVERADSALYQAKRQGKNRVCAYINH